MSVGTAIFAAMADPNTTVGELFKAKAVTDEQVNAATEAACLH